MESNVTSPDNWEPTLPAYLRVPRLHSGQV